MPYPSEHSCRLHSPSLYSKFSRKNGAREHKGKKYDVIYGIRKSDGKSEEQAFRYPKAVWSESSARSHCKSHKGTFEAAKKSTSSATILEKQPWAILEGDLRQILAKADQDIEAFFDVGEEAFSPLKREGDIGVIDVNGVIFGRSNLLTMLGIGVSTENIAAQFDEALADPEVNKIQFRFDTPGGMFNPTNKLAEKIYASRGIKPIESLVIDRCASAGYIIASATDSIEATDETNWIGALGVLVTVSRDSGDERVFISSNAPLKNVDPDSIKGQAVYQGMADRLEKIAIDKVARNRGVTTEFVKENFGKGDILLAKEAIQAKMIDKLTNFDGGKSMDKKTFIEQHKALYDEIVAEAVALKETEISAIQEQLDDLKAANDALKTENSALKAENMELKPEPTLPPEAQEKINKLEVALLEGKLSNCIDTVKKDLIALHGKVDSDEIIKIGNHFAAMQATLDTIGGAQGSSSTDDDKKKLIQTEVEKLVESGMTRTEAYITASKKFA